MVATALGVIAITLYTLVIYILVTQGVEGVEGLKEWVKDLFQTQPE